MVGVSLERITSTDVVEWLIVCFVDAVSFDACFYESSVMLIGQELDSSHTVSLHTESSLPMFD